VLLGNEADIAAGDAEIGKVAIGQLRQLAEWNMTRYIEDALLANLF
jgi:hypothetical protein